MWCKACFLVHICVVNLQLYQTKYPTHSMPHIQSIIKEPAHDMPLNCMVYNILNDITYRSLPNRLQYLQV